MSAANDRRALHISDTTSNLLIDNIGLTTYWRQVDSKCLKSGQASQIEDPGPGPTARKSGAGGRALGLRVRRGKRAGGEPVPFTLYTASGP